MRKDNEENLKLVLSGDVERILAGIDAGKLQPTSALKKDGQTAYHIAASQGNVVVLKARVPSLKFSE